VEDFVGGGGDDVFLGEGFDGVGEGLAEAEEGVLEVPGKNGKLRDAGAVGAEAILQAGEEFAFRDGRESEEETEDGEDGDDGDEVVRQPLEWRGEELDEPVAR
jgi:hypothetical protein